MSGTPTGQVVGSAIQDLAAARLGRGFIPLVLVLLVGVGEIIAGVGGWSAAALAVAAPASAGAMLAFGLRVVQTAFGRPQRGWMTLAALASVVPPALGLYLVGWRGLRDMVGSSGAGEVLTALAFLALGVWVLRAWLRLLELQRLAEAMSVDSIGGGQP